MAGFLDKETRIIDMVLTGHGKQLLSQGELEFVYWAPFDDEVDYDPFLSNSGSLSQLELTGAINEHIEATLVREANTGYAISNTSLDDATNVKRPLFTMAQGQNIVPKMKVDDAGGTLEIQVDQYKSTKTFNSNVATDQKTYDVGYVRENSTSAEITLGYEKDSYPSDHTYEGFLLRMYKSGSDGLVELEHKRDASNELAFDANIILKD